MHIPVSILDAVCYRTAATRRRLGIRMSQGDGLMMKGLPLREMNDDVRSSDDVSENDQDLP